MASHRLFTPANFDGLHCYPFRASGDHFPTKGEMTDYLEAHALTFQRVC